jgi:sigma-B regulation protein RsbU (phosphoserine phosphatase)
LSDPSPSEDFEDLYETAPCGYVSISPAARIIKANATLAQWLGRPAAELIGMPIHDILGFGGRIGFETHLAPLLRMQGHVNEIALDLLTSDGEKIPTIGNAAEKRDSDGRHLFTRLTLFKAVDRRSYERNLLEARAKAETASAADRDAVLLRDRFIAVLGHDLRNPLAAVAAGIRLLGRREQLSASGLNILAEMKGSIGRASALVEDLLDLARGSLGGGFIIDRRPEEGLQSLLEQVVAEARRMAPDREIGAQIDIEGPIFCDGGRLGQLASNLLSNALLHGARGEPIGFEARTEGHSFLLSVTNGGAPIPEKVRARLFQPFFRGAARPSQNGLGLGLFIASEIARAHDGTLNVTSTVDETRFTFVMPSGTEDGSGEWAHSRSPDALVETKPA